MSRDIEPADRRLRVLAVSMAAPNVPGGGGPTRAFHILDALCDVADVTLVSLGSGPGRGCVSSKLAGRCVRVIEPVSQPKAEALRRPSRLRSWIRLATVLASPARNNWQELFHYYLQHGRPALGASPRAKLTGRIVRLWWQLASRFSDMPPTQVLFLADAWQFVEAEVLQLAHENQFDVLWCEEALCYWLLQELHNKFQHWQLIAGAHNIEFILRRRLKDTAADRMAVAHWESQVNCCRRLESKIFRRAALTIVCSAEDADAGQRHVATGNFSVVRNGVDTAYFDRSDAAGKIGTPLLLFTGGFGYDPNSDAVRHFVTHILPIVRCSVPDCRFVFAGREALRLRETLASTDPLVTAIDSPEDMRPVFESATVFVVPLLSGGGTRLKILEAMAMQLPIVSTAIGAEGIDCNPGEHLLVADSDQEFARAVVELLRDETRRQSMGKAARTWVCANMDWKIHREQLKKVVLDYAHAHASDLNSSR